MAPKKRVSIPTKLSTKVLKEFRHRCAICGRYEPQLHHLDEDPSNNVAENLLPLCPNCHLQDLHDPTRPPDPRKVRLFRRTRDPSVLDSRFEPLWNRIVFLHQSDEDRVVSWGFCCGDLLKFVEAFNMGGYYSDRIKCVLEQPLEHFTVLKHRGRLDMTDEEIQSDPDRLRELLEYQAELVEDLCVEMLRFQQWNHAMPNKASLTNPLPA